MGLHLTHSWGCTLPCHPLRMPRYGSRPQILLPQKYSAMWSFSA
jgi:hypothetical protein